MAWPNPDTTPAMIPPPGQVSNLDHPYSQQNYIIATSIICSTFVLVAITTRTFVKAYLLRKFQFEDYALITSGLAFAAWIGVLIAAGNVGQGCHMWDLSVAKFQRFLLLENIVEILYGPVLFPAKLCALLQILRIFKGNSRNSVYWTIQILIWVTAGFYLSLLFSFIFSCNPRTKIQDPNEPGTCIDNNALILASGALNIVSDFSILLLPGFAVWRLKLPVKRKLAIFAVFGTGLFACISSIIRLAYSIRLTLTKDVSYAVNAVGLWATAEFTTVIMACAFPTVPRLLQWFRERTKYGPHSQSHSQSHNVSYHPPTNRSYAKVGPPWAPATSSTVAFADEYIALEEPAPTHPTRLLAGFQPIHESRTPRTSMNNASNKEDKVVRKTVRMETSYTPRDASAL